MNSNECFSRVCRTDVRPSELHAYEFVSPFRSGPMPAAHIAQEPPVVQQLKVLVRAVGSGPDTTAGVHSLADSEHTALARALSQLAKQADASSNELAAAVNRWPAARCSILGTYALSLRLAVSQERQERHKPPEPGSVYTRYTQDFLNSGTSRGDGAHEATSPLPAQHARAAGPTAATAQDHMPLLTDSAKLLSFVFQVLRDSKSFRALYDLASELLLADALPLLSRLLLSAQRSGCPSASLSITLEPLIYLLQTSTLLPPQPLPQPRLAAPPSPPPTARNGNAAAPTRGPPPPSPPSLPPSHPEQLARDLISALASSGVIEHWSALALTPPPVASPPAAAPPSPPLLPPAGSPKLPPRTHLSPFASETPLRGGAYDGIHTPQSKSAPASPSRSPAPASPLLAGVQLSPFALAGCAGGAADAASAAIGGGPHAASSSSASTVRAAARKVPITGGGVAEDVALQLRGLLPLQELLLLCAPARLQAAAGSSAQPEQPQQQQLASRARALLAGPRLQQLVAAVAVSQAFAADGGSLYGAMAREELLPPVLAVDQPPAQEWQQGGTGTWAPPPQQQREQQERLDCQCLITAVRFWSHCLELPPSPLPPLPLTTSTVVDLCLRVAAAALGSLDEEVAGRARGRGRVTEPPGADDRQAREEADGSEAGGSEWRSGGGDGDRRTSAGGSRSSCGGGGSSAWAPTASTSCSSSGGGAPTSTSAPVAPMHVPVPAGRGAADAPYHAGMCRTAPCTQLDPQNCLETAFRALRCAASLLERCPESASVSKGDLSTGAAAVAAALTSSSPFFIMARAAAKAQEAAATAAGMDGGAGSVSVGGLPDPRMYDKHFAVQYWSLAVRAVHAAVDAGSAVGGNGQGVGGTALMCWALRLLQLPLPHELATAQDDAEVPLAPPHGLSGALSCGYLPCLERLLRHVAAQPDCHAGDPLHAAAVESYIRWPVLRLLMAYGEEQHAASLLSTVAKVLLRGLGLGAAEGGGELGVQGGVRRQAGGSGGARAARGGSSPTPAMMAPQLLPAVGRLVGGMATWAMAHGEGTEEQQSQVACGYATPGAAGAAAVVTATAAGTEVQPAAARHTAAARPSVAKPSWGAEGISLTPLRPLAPQVSTTLEPCSPLAVPPACLPAQQQLLRLLCFGVTRLLPATALIVDLAAGSVEQQQPCGATACSAMTPVAWCVQLCALGHWVACQRGDGEAARSWRKLLLADVDAWGMMQRWERRLQRGPRGAGGQLAAARASAGDMVTGALLLLRHGVSEAEVVGVGGEQGGSGGAGVEGRGWGKEEASQVAREGMCEMMKALAGLVVELRAPGEGGSVLGTCANPLCVNLAGASEAELMARADGKSTARGGVGGVGAGAGPGAYCSPTCRREYGVLVGMAAEGQGAAVGVGGVEWKEGMPGARVREQCCVLM